MARLRYPIVAFLVLLFLVTGWLGREPTMTKGMDELTYLSLSRSLQSGSYRDFSMASAPLHVKYPPVYPAWLVLVRSITGENHDLLRVSNLALLAVALVLLFAVARRLVGTELALGFLVLLALNREMLWMGGSLMSEGLFLLLTTAALAATLPTDRAAAGRGFLAAGLALLAFLTRSAGIALVVGVGLWAWSARRRVRGLFPTYLVASAVVVGGWFAYVSYASRHGGHGSYATEASRPAARNPAPFVVKVVVGAASVAKEYATTELPFALALPTVRGTVIDNLIGVGILAVLLVAGLVPLARSWPAAAAYWLLYGAVLLVWPWADHRLVTPMVPLTLLAVLLGARGLSQYLPARARGPTLGAVVVLLAIGGVQGAVQRIVEYRDCDRSRPYSSPGCYDQVALSLAAGSEYIRAHAAPDDIVLTERSQAIGFLSGHLTERSEPLLRTPPGEVVGWLRARHIRFIFLPRMAWWESARLAPLLLASCHQLRLEGHFPPRALLLSTDPPETAHADACAALTAIAKGGDGKARELSPE